MSSISSSKIDYYFIFPTMQDDVNFNAENEERRIEMDPLSTNSLVSQARHQTWQPTIDGLNAGFDGNVANEVLIVSFISN